MIIARPGAYESASLHSSGRHFMIKNRRESLGLGNAGGTRLEKESAAAGGAGLLLILCVILFDLSYPNPLFSILLMLGLPLVLVSSGMFIAAWVMDVRLAYKRKQFVLLAVLILGAILFALWHIIFKRG